jgi:hypothetical protein
VLLSFQRENIGQDDNRIASGERKQQNGQLKANIDQGADEQVFAPPDHPGIRDSQTSFLHENPGADHRGAPADPLSFNAYPVFHLPYTLVGAHLFHENGQEL